MYVKHIIPDKAPVQQNLRLNFAFSQFWNTKGQNMVCFWPCLYVQHSKTVGQITPHVLFASSQKRPYMFSVWLWQWWSIACLVGHFVCPVSRSCCIAYLVGEAPKGKRLSAVCPHTETLFTLHTCSMFKELWKWHTRDIGADYKW